MVCWPDCEGTYSHSIQLKFSSSTNSTEVAQLVIKSSGIAKSMCRYVHELSNNFKALEVSTLMILNRRRESG